MKIVSPEEYLNASMFNLTKLIKENYEKGTPLTIEFMKNINYSELGKKEFYYQFDDSPFLLTIEHSALENIIKSLPLKYYKDYMQFNWIYAGVENKHTLIQSALSSKAMPFIKEFLVLGQDYLNDNIKDPYTRRSKTEEYVYSCLSSVLSLEHYLSFYGNKNPTSDDDEVIRSYQEVSYKEIFDLAIKQFEIVQDKSNNIHFIIKEQLFNHKTWFKDLDILNQKLGKQNNSQEILEKTIKYSNAFEFFVDIYSQYNQDENPYHDEQYLNIAIKEGNLKIIKLLNNHFKHDQKYYQAKIKNTLINWSEHEAQTFRDSISRSNKLEKDDYIIKMLPLLKEYFPNTEELEINKMHTLFLTKNPTIQKNLVKIFPQILTSKILEDLTLTEIIYCVDTLNDFSIKINQPLNFKNINFKSYAIYLGGILKQYSLPISDLTIERKFELHSLIEKEYFFNLSTKLDKDETLIQFREYVLEISLKNTNNTTKKMKI